MDLTKEKLKDLLETHGSIREVAKATNRSPKTISAKMKEYDVSYERSYRKYKVKHEFFAEENEETYYWAGFVAAGANIVNQGEYRIEFNISSRDREHLERFNESLGTDAPVKDFLTKKKHFINDHVRTVISSKYLVSDLEEKFGITPKKKFTYMMPRSLVASPLIRHFIRGWLDGMGGFTNHNGHLTFSTRGTPNFIYKLSHIFDSSLEMSVLWKDHVEIKPTENPEIAQLSVHDTRVLEAIFKYLYTDATFFLQRKYAEADHLLEGTK